MITRTITALDLAELVRWAESNPDRPFEHQINATIYDAKALLKSIGVMVVGVDND